MFDPRLDSPALSLRETTLILSDADLRTLYRTIE
jgi:hypothetical protein